MNGSPINRILAGMAVADILLIIEYLPFLIGREFWQSDDHNMTWGWSAYMWFHSNFRLVCTLGDSRFFKTSRYQGIVKATVFGVHI